LKGLSVKDVMTAAPVAVDSNAFLSEALALMENRESQITVLPVTEDGVKCIGAVRLHDLVRSGM
jgi:arabinose-5-phosphate isomerase